MRRILIALSAVGVALIGLTSSAAAQNDPGYECDNQFGECGAPDQSGSGGGSVLVDRTDRGDTYQSADDYDDDGIEDDEDNCPRTANPDQSDSDGDGVGNACDNCLNVSNEDQSDIDGDGSGDACDPDMDGDEIVNEEDNCPEIPNPRIDGEQPDTDGDGEGDACDDDIDGDGEDNLEDPCPADPNITNPDNTEPGSTCFPDKDGDGVDDIRDNCARVFNPNQANEDGDRFGNACDPDIDGDGIQNPHDNCSIEPNPDQVDLDRDGIGEACDDDFCYVVMGDEENCLDPEGVLDVYSPTRVEQTGETFRLRLFANRRNAALKYKWRLKGAPRDSEAHIENREGTVSVSTPFEYRYQEDSIPTVVPDKPGTYRFEVEVQPIFRDRAEDENSEDVRPTHTVPVRVEGEPVALPGTSGGCSQVESAQPSPLSSGLWLALLGLVGSFVGRRTD